MDSPVLFWIKVQWRVGWNNCTGPSGAQLAGSGPIYPANLHLLQLNLHLKLCNIWGNLQSVLERRKLHLLSVTWTIRSSCARGESLHLAMWAMIYWAWQSLLSARLLTRCQCTFCTWHLNVPLELCNAQLITFGHMGCLDIILIKCLKGLKSQKSLFETKLSTVTESAARPPTHPRRVLIRAAGASKKKSDSDKLITILMTSFPCCSLYFKVSLPYVIIWLIFWQLCCLWCQCQLNRTYSFHCLCLVLDTFTLSSIIEHWQLTPHSHQS